MFYFSFLEGDSNILKEICGMEYIKRENGKLVYKIKLFDTTSIRHWKTITSKKLGSF